MSTTNRSHFVCGPPSAAPQLRRRNVSPLSGTARLSGHVAFEIPEMPFAWRAYLRSFTEPLLHIRRASLCLRCCHAHSRLDVPGIAKLVDTYGTARLRAHLAVACAPSSRPSIVGSSHEGRSVTT